MPHPAAHVSVSAVLRDEPPRSESLPIRSGEDDSPSTAALINSVARALTVPQNDPEARVATRRVTAASASALTSSHAARRIAAQLALPADDPQAVALAAEAATLTAHSSDRGASTASKWNSARAAHFEELLAHASMVDATGREASSSAGSSSAPYAGAPSTGLSASWLRERVASTLSGTEGDVSPGEAAASMLSLLQDEKRSAEEIQGMLFDALSYDFEAVAEVLARRAEIIAIGDAVLADCLGEVTAAPVHNPRELGAARRRQRDRRLNAQDGPRPTLSGSAAAELQRQFPGINPEGAIGVVDSVGLPAGSTRVNGDGYEEIFIPPPKSASRVHKLIEVKDAFVEHPELLQAMRGVTTFNRLQSIVFPVAYQSPENMLVCAPTGAGKTNVALLTIFQQIIAVKKHEQRNFKIVYVAPMKALAAEVVEKFGKKLAPLGLRVREYTGDMNLTRKEAAETHVLVTTPEKWDVVTRKRASSLSTSITLLIVDEVHLLHDDRGAVLESIVARTLRLSETAQTRIRLVGLSATLPNYQDVADFLKVNPDRGLFHFDSGYRPVPLSQAFIGVSAGTESNSFASRRKNETRMGELTWDKVRDSLQRGHQAMVFVHSRKATASSARELIELANKDGIENIFVGGSSPAANGDVSPMPTWAAREISKARSSDIRELASKGIGIHNAGLPRPDRKLVERLFAEGLLRVMCCTATLAWGVNLPARTVVIKGTDVYNAEKGGFEQLGMLDVMQIFGRAGRPQFDTEGEGVIITKHENLGRYLSLLTAAVPIESTLGASTSKLADHLNAETVSGTVRSIGEGVKWLSYTYLSVRMPKNPLVYGIDWDDVAADPHLHSRRATLVEQAARALDDARMCRYNPKNGTVAATELGRVCSHFYVSHRTVVIWNDLLEDMSWIPEDSDSEAGRGFMYSAILHAVSQASEFEQLRSRNEEEKELETLRRACPPNIELKSGPETKEGKVAILLMAYISRIPVRMSDLSYISQSCTRLLRAFFEITMRKGIQGVALAALELARASECQIWPFQHPLLQFSYHARRGSGFVIPREIIAHLVEIGSKGTLSSLRKLDDSEFTSIVRFPKNAQIVKRSTRSIPIMSIVDTLVGPISQTLLRFRVVLRPEFTWNDSIHGNIESWWFWIEDKHMNRVYYSERITLNKEQVEQFSSIGDSGKQGASAPKELVLDLKVPVFSPPSSHYWMKVESEHWHTGGGSTKMLNLSNMALPQAEPPHTELLDLRPLRVRRVLPFHFAKSYFNQFTHFNPMQTQLFHALYNSSVNLFASLPLGSGKTVLAELAMFQAVRDSPTKSVIYIAPCESLARKRGLDWKRRFSTDVFSRIVGVFGDNSQVDHAQKGTLFVTTPAGLLTLSLSWTLPYFRENVSLVIADDLHLTGEPGGHELEFAVSRMKYLSTDPGKQSTGRDASEVRMVGLSAPLANPMEYANWLDVNMNDGVFHFSSRVRHVPCKIELVGIDEELFLHRMQSMNRLIYSSIVKLGFRQGVIVFTSSPKQVKLTAQDLLRNESLDGKEGLFSRNSSLDVPEMRSLMDGIADPDVRRFLRSGIIVVHPALPRRDQDMIAKVFELGYCKVLITTFDAAWSTSFRGTNVIVKGTERYCVDEQRFVDIGIVNILQMIGKAGRANLDDKSEVFVLAHERKKTLLRTLLFNPLPVESQLHHNYGVHMQREVKAGRVRNAQDACDALSWTFLFRRILMNPAFYGVRTHGKKDVSVKKGDLDRFCSSLAVTSLSELWKSGEITVAPSTSEKRRDSSK